MVYRQGKGNTFLETLAIEVGEHYFRLVTKETEDGFLPVREKEEFCGQFNSFLRKAGHIDLYHFNLIQYLNDELSYVWYGFSKKENELLLCSARGNHLGKYNQRTFFESPAFEFKINSFNFYLVLNSDKKTINRLKGFWWNPFRRFYSSSLKAESRCQIVEEVKEKSLKELSLTEILLRVAESSRDREVGA